MARAAIFVEGLTELLFVKRLIVEMADASRVAVSEERRRAGGYISLAVNRPTGQQHDVLIVDCCGDGAVLTAIIERYAGLTAAGYSLVVGLRDLYPKRQTELSRVISETAGLIPMGGPPVHLVIALSEVEAWFVQEDLHYHFIDPSLTRTNIMHSLGYDIESDLAENLHHPAQHLNKIYKLANKAYRKKGSSINRTVNNLDLVNLYVEKRHILQKFDEFVTILEVFLR